MTPTELRLAQIEQHLKNAIAKQKEVRKRLWRETTNG